MRSLLFVLFLALLLPACSDSQAPPADQAAGPGPLPPPGAGSGGGGGGAGGGGGPPPTASVAFDDAAVDLMHPGGYPSDLVVDGSGQLYTVADAQIPARVVSSAGGAGTTATATGSETRPFRRRARATRPKARC